MTSLRSPGIPDRLYARDLKRGALALRDFLLCNEYWKLPLTIVDGMSGLVNCPKNSKLLIPKKILFIHTERENTVYNILQNL